MRKIIIIYVFLSTLVLSCTESILIDSDSVEKLKTIELSAEEYLSIAFSNVEEFSQSQLLDLIMESDFVNKNALTRSGESTFKCYFVNEEFELPEITPTRGNDLTEQLLIYEIEMQNGNSTSVMSI